jgi:hypothetical protein
VPRVKRIVLKWEWRTAIRWIVNGAPFVYKEILFLISHRRAVIAG